MMNDLNKLAVPVNAPGDYGVHDPKNAWPGAGTDVRVSMNFVGPNLVQFGYSVGTEEVWTRRRKASGEEPWSEWAEAGSGTPPPVEPPASGIIAGRATYEDGEEEVLLPDYVKLNCLSVTGSAAVIEAGDLRIKMEGDADIEIRATVTHDVGTEISLGIGWDGGAPEEFARHSLTEAPGFVIRRATMTLEMDSLLAIYLSANSDAEATIWSDVECQIVKWE